MDRANRTNTLAVAGALLLLSNIASAAPQAETTAPADTATGETALAAQGDAAPATEAAAEDTAAPEPAVVAEPAPEPEPAAEAAEALPLAGYDGGFFIQSKDGAFKLTIGARLKLRYNFSSTDMGPNVDREFDNNFSVPYARLYFSGHLFNKKLTYLINPGFGGGKMKLVLAFADYAFIKDVLHLTLGQMKRPFSRNYLTSSGKRAFIDNPLGQFGHGIDLGLQLSNNFTKVKGLEWAVGVFNSANALTYRYSGGTLDGELVLDDAGNPTGEVTGDVSGGGFSNAISDFKPAMVARIGYNNGVKGYYPTDFEGGGVRFGLAMSGHIDFNADRSDNGNAYFGFDYILKVHGFSFNGGLYTQWEQLYSGNPGYLRLGSFNQLQYLIADRFEPVFRYGIVAPQGADNNEQEITVGFTIYVFKQNFKWENNFSTFLEQTVGDALVNFQYVSQLQFLF